MYIAVYGDGISFSVTSQNDRTIFGIHEEVCSAQGTAVWD